MFNATGPVCAEDNITLFKFWIICPQKQSSSVQRHMRDNSGERTSHDVMACEHFLAYHVQSEGSKSKTLHHTHADKQTYFIS